jgi:hypothetical protein
MVPEGIDSAAAFARLKGMTAAVGPREVGGWAIRDRGPVALVNGGSHMCRSLRLLAWCAVFVPCVANAQIASLVTHKAIPACRTVEDGKLLAQAIELRQLAMFKQLLESGRCVVWEKGTTIWLDQSVEGCGLTRIRGICEAVYARADKRDPQVYIAPLDEAWTRRQLPAPATENLTVLLSKLNDPIEPAAAAPTLAEAAATPVAMAAETTGAVPLPRSRPGSVKPKHRTFAQTLAAQLTKLFPPVRAGTTVRDRSNY